MCKETNAVMELALAGRVKTTAWVGGAQWNTKGNWGPSMKLGAKSEGPKTLLTT